MAVIALAGTPLLISHRLLAAASVVRSPGAPAPTVIIRFA